MLARKLRILSVDDNQGVQILLRVLLNAEHCTLMQATNGEDAKAILLTQPMIDLVILDLRMPRGDGPSFLAWRQSDPEFQQIPIIILSGDVAIESIARQHNVAFFLEKGSHPTRLVEMIKSIMQERGHSFPATA